MNHRHPLQFALCLSVFLAACSPTRPDTGVINDGTYVAGTGTISYYALEGGFWAIRGDDSVTYDPINLEKSYWTSGLRIRFRALLRKDLGGFHMVGPIVELLEIKRL